jgi:hypothetical protein
VPVDAALGHYFHQPRTATGAVRGQSGVEVGAAAEVVSGVVERLGEVEQINSHDVLPLLSGEPDATDDEAGIGFPGSV